MSSIDQVLSDFIDAWNAGRRPRVREYLQRVPEGAERDELADQITTWLEVAPTPEYDEAAGAQIRAEPMVQHVFEAVDDDAGLWPAMLPRLRARAGLSMRDVAAQIVSRFGLGGGDEERADDYVQRLERGELEPSRVSRRLLDALGELLGVGGGTLADAGRLGVTVRLTAPGGTLFRAEGRTEEWVAHDIEALSEMALTPAPPAMDELDRLFIGGADA
jgi:transcriptional regulator with XRE-family HTH domain